ncbi:helix-turn-helix domain-containing protein [Caulobacter rhizosphaerae]|uniref:helix-turn-helix domain-containing protein n=1 Tax=Caulobacter rhizosphaerae TaxID=2010972 RepID=UPI0013D7ACFE|nr:helix-turn-helix transcriptional regulator [Caulobacter rhizosphaerae]GGL48156.1 transcriptional regulator [Caulobacter rhizosphaerae]
MASADEHQPHQVDLHVGRMIRMRRRHLNISQEKLADALGLTFQQVQKYERGSNRVSASKLYEIARFLKTTPASFYEGLPADDYAEAATPPELLDLLGQYGGFEIAQLFIQLRSDQRTNVIRIAQAILDATALPPEAIAA